MRRLWRWIKRLREPEVVVITEWLGHDLLVTTNKGRYRGSCTCWYDAETGAAIRDHGSQWWLLSVWKKAKWEREAA